MPIDAAEKGVIQIPKSVWKRNYGILEKPIKCILDAARIKKNLVPKFDIMDILVEFPLAEDGQPLGLRAYLKANTPVFRQYGDIEYQVKYYSEFFPRRQVPGPSQKITFHSITFTIVNILT
eukprot:CAMPEP_0203745610 /NCGR_PEP_ID=MMETSP0098-20131031/1288_1 /ASSEMBLY_ACC=CAM_ASM_000208 /TAXON_ID=96639 /ORGANISM=" , Strain NY0313808BC1" /LENGTH=120 /DNA_ID=CAMNT_0050633437 /DNA_START=1288 /DNA_END=1650 /DNA_ORIENTATION=+